MMTQGSQGKSADTEQEAKVGISPQVVDMERATFITYPEMA
jgi:hypothetical protein